MQQEWKSTAVATAVAKPKRRRRRARSCKDELIIVITNDNVIVQMALLEKEESLVVRDQRGHQCSRMVGLGGRRANYNSGVCMAE
jgi:ribosomal protein L18